MNLITMVEKLAPTAATLLAGPFAGMAVSALGDALGISEPTKAKLTEAFKSQQLSGDQLLAVKKAEQELTLKLEELGVRREELDASDRKSARDMQISVGSGIPGIFAMVVTSGFFGILIIMLLEDIKPSEPLLVMLGSLGTAWSSIVGFYFGSSQGSRNSQQAILDRIK